MPDDIDLKQAFDRAAGSAPYAPAALAGLRTRIRKAHQRRALARGGAGLLGVVAVGGIIMNIGGDGSGTEVAVTGPGASDTSGLTSTTFASTTFGSTTFTSTSGPTVSTGASTTPTVTVASSSSAPTTGSVTTIDPSIPGTFELVPTTRPGGLQAAVFTSEGGTIVVDYTSNAMTLTSVAANPGWTVAESRANPDDIDVRFEDEDGDESRIRVRLIDGRPVQDEDGQGPGGDEDSSGEG
jgi:hypothetical protein